MTVLELVFLASLQKWNKKGTISYLLDLWGLSLSLGVVEAAWIAVRVLVWRRHIDSLVVTAAVRQV